MSSKTKTSRKAKNPRAKAPEPIITRTKSRQLRNREEKKIEKPELTKPEIKSPKVTARTVKRQVSLLKVPEEESAAVDEQAEYYPNTLKRDVTTKKIMLKPKHNFKVIAATNKRKLATPQKGIKSSLSKHSSPQNGSKSLKRSKISSRPCSSPELSMQDMVRMMEDTRSLSDEDFMEILTCPSPVWWEDPPDGRFNEDSVHTRSPETPPEKTTKKRKLAENKKSSKSSNNSIITIEHDIEQPKVIENKKDERFVKKKQKLEHILGNIKNKSIQPKNVAKNYINNKNRKISESEGDFSDLSFNEEEILKNLENMEIPIEQSVALESNDPSDNKSEIDEIEIKEEAIDIHENEIIPSKNDNVDREILTIEIKPEIKEEFTIRSPVFDKDNIPNTSSEFKSDASIEEMNSNSDKKSDDIVIVDSCTNFSLGNNDDSSSIIDLNYSSYSDMGNESPKECTSNVDVANNSNKMNNNEIVPNKKTKDLITVYKITSEKLKINNVSKPAENTNITKLDTVRGKLNDFFKQCKSTMRVKKTEIPIPAVPVTDVRETIDNKKENGDTKIDLEDDKNRLRNCDYCIEKTEKGETNFSCDKCEMAPILPCGLCNFLVDSKEVSKKQVFCKDAARISWSHNYVLNQT